MNEQIKIPKVVFISGLGRSGTSWLAEMLNYGQVFRYVFEPFHPFMQVFPEYHPMRYIREQDRNPNLTEPIRKLFYDDFENTWTDAYNGPNAKSCGSRLIKGIRSNLMVPWLAWMYLENKFIVILRHPCAVAVSRVKYSQNMGEWECLDIADDLFGQPELVADHLLPYDDLPTWPTAKDWFYSSIDEWCVAHHVLLKYKNKSNIIFVHYENLVENPIPELVRLWLFITGQKYFGDDLPSLPSDLIPTLDGIDRPSAQINPGYSAVVKKHNLLGNWMGHATQHQLDYVRDTLKLFKLDTLYSEDSCLPLER